MSAGSAAPDLMVAQSSFTFVDSCEKVLSVS
jgi:hypothetical protein